MFLTKLIEALPQETQDSLKKAGKKKREEYAKKRPGIDYNVPGSADPLIFYNFFTPTKEASGITTKETMGFKKGKAINAKKKRFGGMAIQGVKDPNKIHRS
tara:strand:- start:1125 stop:1427 length:303 start_codon:yes stop_codon:yes gene_type:complete